MEKRVLILSLKCSPGLIKEMVAIGDALSSAGAQVLYWIHRDYQQYHPHQASFVYNSFELGPGVFFKDKKTLIKDVKIQEFINHTGRTCILFYSPHLHNPTFAKAFKQVCPSALISLYLHDPWKTNIKPYGFKKGAYFKAADYYQKFGAKYFDLIVSPSPRSSALFKSYYRSFKGKHFVAPLLVPPSEAHQLNHNQDKPRFLMLGRYNPARGYDRFIKIVEYVDHHQLNFELCWLTTHAYYQSLKSIIPEDTLAKIKIIIKDPLLDSDIDDCIQECMGAFRFDREITQSGVVPVIFKNKVPVIAPNISGFSQFIHHQKNGILLDDPDDPNEVLRAMEYCCKHFDTLSQEAYQSYLEIWHPDNGVRYYHALIQWLDGQTLDTKESKKVTLLCQLFYPELISTGQVMTELFSELAKQNYDPEVICARPTLVDRRSSIDSFTLYQNIRIRRLFSTRLPKLKTITKLFNQLSFCFSLFMFLVKDRSKHPIILSTDPPYIPWVGAFAKWFNKRPIIQIIFDVYPHTLENFGLIKRDGFISKLWVKLNQWSWNQASALIVIGRCMEARLEATYPKLKSKIHRISLWSLPEVIHPIKKEDNPFIQKHQLEGKFIVLYSGNMGRFHSLEPIMEAAQACLDDPTIHFVFIGEGYKKQWMQEFAAKHHLSNCLFLSYMDREDLAYSMSMADLALVSLEDNQQGLSVPSKTYGYLAAGRAVLAILNPQSEISLLLKEEQCGIQISPPTDGVSIAKTIRNLKDNQKEFEILGKNGRSAILNKYNVENVAKQYHDLISALNI